jgi:hypothetical protein
MNYFIHGVSISTNPQGLIIWMSDWADVDAMANAGLLRREHRSGHGDPYGQTTRYYVTTLGRAESD